MTDGELPEHAEGERGHRARLGAGCHHPARHGLVGDVRPGDQPRVDPGRKPGGGDEKVELEEEARVVPPGRGHPLDPVPRPIEVEDDEVAPADPHGHPETGELRLHVVVSRQPHEDAVDTNEREVEHAVHVEIEVRGGAEEHLTVPREPRKVELVHAVEAADHLGAPFAETPPQRMTLDAPDRGAEAWRRGLTPLVVGRGGTTMEREAVEEQRRDLVEKRVQLPGHGPLAEPSFRLREDGEQRRHGAIPGPMAQTRGAGGTPGFDRGGRFFRGMKG